MTGPCTLVMRSAELRSAGVLSVQYHRYLDFDPPYRRLPLPWATLVVTLSGARRWRWVGEAWRTFPSLALRGHTDHWSEGADDPAALPEYLTALIDPWAVPSFFGVPGSAIYDRVIDLRELFRESAHLLEEKVRAAKTPTARTVVVASWLLQQATTAKSPALVELSAIGRALNEMPIEQVPEYVGLSRREYRRRFRDGVGITPKRWLRLDRFANQVRELHPSGWTDAQPSILDYFDQSHAIHEFREFAGITPGAYRRIKAHGDRRLFLIPA